MKKETVFAILLGIGAGVLIALWVIRGTQPNTKGDNLAMDDKITPSISISNTLAEPLLISKPEDGYLSSVDTVEIKGSSKKGSLIIVQSPVQEITEKITSDDFQIKIKLMEGMNNVLITSYKEKNIETHALTIYYVQEQ
jgi:hypothetical protein